VSEVGPEEPTARYYEMHLREHSPKFLTDFLTIEFLTMIKIIFGLCDYLSDIIMSSRIIGYGGTLHSNEFQYLHSIISSQIHLYQGEFNFNYNSDLG
jgi:hypothetical protein